MMAVSSAESLTLKDAFTNWLSITALRHIPPDKKSVFRKLEKLELKIIRQEGHLEFNQACVYIYIYIYIYVVKFLMQVICYELLGFCFYFPEVV